MRQAKLYGLHRSPLTRRQVFGLGGALAAGATTLGSHSAHAIPTLAGNSLQVEGDLNMWTFFDQVNIAAEQFMAANPGVNMEVQVFPGDQYETKMQLGLQTGEDAPDLFDTDVGYQGKYINGPFMEDLSAMGIDDAVADYIPYLQGLSQDAQGVTKGIIDHSAPGGFWFRRDVAQEYLGTGDHEEVALLVDSWDKIIELGSDVATQSNGEVHLIDNIFAVFRVEQVHMDPWVVDGTLTIDPRWNDALDAMRQIRENNVDARLDTFSASWGAAWNNGSVIMFPMPSWAGFLINPDETGNNWGIAKAPKPYYSGGRFSSIYTQSGAKEIALEYLRFVAGPEWQQYNLESTLNMPARQSVYEENMTSFTDPLFGDQRILETYHEIAMAIPSRPSDQYAGPIGGMFTTAVSDMILGEQPNEAAFASLRQQVQSAYPDLQVD